MIDAVAFALTIGALVAALTVAVRLAGRRHTWRATVPLLALLEVGLILQLLMDVIGLVAGHRPAEPGTHVAYLVTSVLPVPVAAGQARGDDGTWAGLLLVLALLVVAVLVVRLQTTWRSAG